MSEIPRKVETRAIDDLHEHPEQAHLFGEVSEAEIEELAQSMLTHGLQIPIEILPDGTIFKGHQRVRAAKQLGWSKIDIVVRHDLADADELTILSLMVEDNLVRRQLDPVALARTYRYLKEIERDKDYRDMNYVDRGDIRDRLASRLGGKVSGRTLDRYEKVLNTPRPIQDAVSRRRLPIGVANKIVNLPQEDQEEIAERIVDGEPARKVASEYLDSSEPTEEDHSGAYQRFITGLRRGIADLHQHVDEVVGCAMISGDVLPILEESAVLIERLRSTEAANREAVSDRLGDLADDNEDWE